MDINCSVTVMLIHEDFGIGFIRRDEGDTYQEQQAAPGGKVEPSDGLLVDGVQYWSVEHAAVREVKEETGILLNIGELFYFCSLVLPNGRVVISMYAMVDDVQKQIAVDRGLVFLLPGQVEGRTDFAPGMKQETLALIKDIGLV